MKFNINGESHESISKSSAGTTSKEQRQQNTNAGISTLWYFQAFKKALASIGNKVNIISTVGRAKLNTRYYHRVVAPAGRI